MPVGVEYGRLVLHVFCFKQSRDCVEPEASHSLVQPEPQHTEDRLLNLWIAPVQVRLLGVELMVVKLLRCRVVLPS